MHNSVAVQLHKPATSTDALLERVLADCYCCSHSKESSSVQLPVPLFHHSTNKGKVRHMCTAYYFLRTEITRHFFRDQNYSENQRQSSENQSTRWNWSKTMVVPGFLIGIVIVTKTITIPKETVERLTINSAQVSDICFRRT